MRSAHNLPPGAMLRFLLVILIGSGIALALDASDDVCACPAMAAAAAAAAAEGAGVTTEEGPFAEELVAQRGQAVYAAGEGEAQQARAETTRPPCHGAAADSHAVEHETLASQTDSHALERDSIASQRDSHAAEHDSIASQADSHAAEHDGSHALERDSRAAEHDASDCACPSSAEGCGCGCVAAPLSTSHAPALLARNNAPQERWNLQPAQSAAPAGVATWAPASALPDMQSAARPPPDGPPPLRAGPRLHIHYRQLLI